MADVVVMLFLRGKGVKSMLRVCMMLRWVALQPRVFDSQLRQHCVQSLADLNIIIIDGTEVF